MSDETTEGPTATLFIANVEAFVWRGADGRYLMIERGADEEIAPGTLVPPGGKVEPTDGPDDALAATLRREVHEETGVEIEGEVFIESHIFEGSVDGHAVPILDLVFWCRYAGGEAAAQDAREVAALAWLTPEEIRLDPRVMPWTLASFERAEATRRSSAH